MSPENAEQPTDLLVLNRPWYWPSEVAKICHVSRNTVYNWIQEGKITTILKIRPFKIRREEVERMLNGG
jgi:excisionase family DNA binding protein